MRSRRVAAAAAAACCCRRVGVKLRDSEREIRAMLRCKARGCKLIAGLCVRLAPGPLCECELPLARSRRCPLRSRRMTCVAPRRGKVHGRVTVDAR